jgi:hypothetical protein
MIKYLALRYLSSQITLLCLLFIVTKQYYILNLFMPLMITIGITITVYLYLFFTGFKRYNVDIAMKHSYYINRLIQRKGYFFFKQNEKYIKFFVSIIHFILFPVIYYIYQSDKTVLKRNKSDIIISLIISIVYERLYNYFADKNTYKVINVDKANSNYYALIIFYPVLLVTTLLYYLSI